MNSLPDIQSVFKALQEKSHLIVQAVLNSDFSALSKVLIDFKLLVGVLFEDGWDVCPSFETFSKPDSLNLREETFGFIAKDTPIVPAKFLRLKTERRGIIVDILSSLAILFKRAATEERFSDTLPLRLSFTAIWGLLPGFQSALFSWIKSKVDIRKIFL